MTDVLVVVVTLAFFVLGFFIVKRFDAFIDENNRILASTSGLNSRCVRIAAENPEYFDAVASALASVSDSNPALELHLSSARAKRLLFQLSNAEIDIALLSMVGAGDLDEAFGCTPIACSPNSITGPALGLPVENIDDDPLIFVVWNKAVPSRDRDRVLFVLENAI